MRWRWPWVSRARLDAAIGDYETLYGVLREAKIVAQTGEREAYRRYDDLLARYHMLKLQGFDTRESALAPAKQPEYDPVISAVNNACAGKDVRVRADMLRQVAIDRAAKLSNADIILRIQRGNRPADEVQAPTTQNPGEDRPPS